MTKTEFVPSHIFIVVGELTEFKGLVTYILPCEITKFYDKGGAFNISEGRYNIDVPEEEVKIDMSFLDGLCYVNCNDLEKINTVSEPPEEDTQQRYAAYAFTLSGKPEQLLHDIKLSCLMAYKRHLVGLLARQNKLSAEDLILLDWNI